MSQLLIAAAKSSGFHIPYSQHDDEGRLRFIDPLIRLKKPARDVIAWLTGTVHEPVMR